MSTDPGIGTVPATPRTRFTDRDFASWVLDNVAAGNMNAARVLAADALAAGAELSWDGAPTASQTPWASSPLFPTPDVGVPHLLRVNAHVVNGGTSRITLRASDGTSLGFVALNPAGSDGPFAAATITPTLPYSRLVILSSGTGVQQTGFLREATLERQA